jgi:hypothetical protein
LVVGHPIGVLKFCRLQRDELQQGLAARIRSVGPILLDWTPELFQPFVIGVAVLHDQAGDAFRVFQCQPPTHGRAVIHHIHRVAGDTELIEQTADEFAETVERVFERRAVRHVALTIAGVIGGNHAIAVRQRRDQVPEHV